MEKNKDARENRAKEEKIRYQNELLHQIEEKKRKAAEEKLKKQKEDEEFERRYEGGTKKPQTAAIGKRRYDKPTDNNREFNTTEMQSPKTVTDGFQYDRQPSLQERPVDQNFKQPAETRNEFVTDDMRNKGKQSFPNAYDFQRPYISSPLTDMNQQFDTANPSLGYPYQQPFFQMPFYPPIYPPNFNDPYQKNQHFFDEMIKTFMNEQMKIFTDYNQRVNEVMNERNEALKENLLMKEKLNALEKLKSEQNKVKNTLEFMNPNRYDERPIHAKQPVDTEVSHRDEKLQYSTRFEPITKDQYSKFEHKYEELEHSMLESLNQTLYGVSKFVPIDARLNEEMRDLNGMESFVVHKTDRSRGVAATVQQNRRSDKNLGEKMVKNENKSKVPIEKSIENKLRETKAKPKPIVSDQKNKVSVDEAEAELIEEEEYNEGLEFDYRNPDMLDSKQEEKEEEEEYDDFTNKDEEEDIFDFNDLELSQEDEVKPEPKRPQNETITKSKEVKKIVASSVNKASYDFLGKQADLTNVEVGEIEDETEERRDIIEDLHDNDDYNENEKLKRKVDFLDVTDNRIGIFENVVQDNVKQSKLLRRNTLS